MKKLFIAVLLLGGLTAQANQITNLNVDYTGIRHNNTNSITVVERGIEFTIYKNGNLDYAPVNNRVERQGRRATQIRTAPRQIYGVTYSNRTNKSVRYNRAGQLKQVGTTHITYNRYGQVKQIGTTSLRYTNGKLASVNNKRILYNRRGAITNVSANSRR